MAHARAFGTRDRRKRRDMRRFVCSFVDIVFEVVGAVLASNGIFHLQKKRGQTPMGNAVEAACLKQNQTQMKTS